jgi:hypothetical protein
VYLYINIIIVMDPRSAHCIPRLHLGHGYTDSDVVLAQAPMTAQIARN